jgi:hypothetical protein
MEKQINKRIDDYMTDFKEKIKEKMIELGLTEKEEMHSLIQFIYNYDIFQLDKDDLVKRKRTKNTISYFDRCCAKRSTGEQCTRKKKDGCEYCGTHVKGIPHGIVEELKDEGENKDSTFSTQKIEVWVQDIHGIMYYIDKNGNVYQAEDIVMNKLNPKIIAKYIKVENQYKIPEFGI